MPKFKSEYSGNGLLNTLASTDLDLLSKYLEWVDLEIGQVIHSPKLPTKFIYFPISGLCSVLSTGLKGGTFEVGVVGKEGLVGLAICLFVSKPALNVVALTTSRSARISEGNFLRIYNSNVNIRKMVLRYSYAFLVQVSQTAVATAKMTIEQRLARWLLMCQDRLGIRDLPVTHQVLSDLLGVRRSGVTVAMQAIESNGAIKAMRGHVRIVDRIHLKKIAGTGYGHAELEYDEIMQIKSARTE